MRETYTSLSYKITIGNCPITVTLDPSFTLMNKNIETTEEAVLVGLSQHYHAQYELFFAKDTPFVIQIENKDRHSVKNAAFLVPPLIPHEVKRRSNAFRILFTLPERANADSKSVYANMHKLFSNVEKILTADEKIYAYLEELITLSKKSTAIDIEQTTALIKLIFINLYKNNIETLDKENKAIDNYCVVIEKVIHASYAEDITLAKVAESLHLSTKQTARIIKKHYQKPLHILLREKRLDVASQLLKTTDKPVSEIASFLFFQSESYFFRLFREKYGMSPLAYRKKYKNASQK